MSNINAVGAIFFSNPAFQAGAGTNADTLENSLGKTFQAQPSGQAFAVALSQQVGANGADDDSVIFESSGQTSNGGGYATVSMSTGSSFSRDFASMLASFQDANPAITNGANTTMAQFGQPAEEMGSVLGQLAANLQNSNSDGTAGIGEEMLPLSASAPGVSSSSNASAEGMSSFLNSIMESLDASLQNPVNGTMADATNSGNSSNLNSTIV